MQCYQREKGHVTFHLGKHSDNQCSSACFIYYLFCQQLYFTSQHPHQYSQWERNLNSPVKWGRGVKQAQSVLEWWPSQTWQPRLIIASGRSRFTANRWISSKHTRHFLNCTKCTKSNYALSGRLKKKKKPWERFLCKQVTAESWVWLTTVLRNLDAFRGEFLKIISVEGGRCWGGGSVAQAYGSLSSQPGLIGKP